MHRVSFVLALLGLGAPAAVAQPAPPSDTFPVDPPGPLALEAGFATGFPAALSTGLAKGVGGAGTLSIGAIRIGARLAWMTASESTLAWGVTHSETQMRALAGIEHVAGRGRIGLRLGLGGSLIHESRERAQGERAGLTGDELRMTAWHFAPAADLELTTAVAVYGAWSAVIAGGPSVVIVDGDAMPTWVAMLGVGWRP